ncbi:hypothetical protein J6590_095926, partial [Homalodisca vitripennis]
MQSILMDILYRTTGTHSVLRLCQGATPRLLQRNREHIQLQRDSTYKLVCLPYKEE